MVGASGDIFARGVLFDGGTWGDFKAELEHRGFNALPDGTLDSWENVAARVETPGEHGVPGEFQFGDKAVSESELLDLAWRFGTDPLNAAFAVGMVGRAPRVAGAASTLVNPARMGAANPARWATPRYDIMDSVERLVPSIRFGVGYADDAARTGARTFPLLPPASAVAEWASGHTMSRMGLQGLGYALRASRAVFVPGPTGLERRLLGAAGLRPRSTLLANYTRGAMRLQIGGVGVELGSGVAADIMEENDLPGSGVMRSIHEAATAIMNNNPIADEPLFIMLAAFKAPAPRVVAEDIRALYSHRPGSRVDPNLRMWAHAFVGKGTFGLRGWRGRGNLPQGHRW
jgi:hypothetical protein